MARLPTVRVDDADSRQWLSPEDIAEAFRLQPRFVRPDFSSVKYTIVTAVVPGSLFCRYIMTCDALRREAEPAAAGLLDETIGQEEALGLSWSCRVCACWAACSLAGFAVAAFRNPGVVPSCGPSDRSGSALQPAMTVPCRHLTVNNIQVKQRWCHTCRVYRPLRSKHCSYCDRCVFRFDHHCTWLGNCVGLGNYRAFLFLVVTCSLFYGHSAWITFKVLRRTLLEDTRVFAEAWSNGLGQVARKTFAVIALKVAYALYAVVMFLAFVVLSLYHAVIIGCNLTTNEHVRDYYLMSGNPFHKSCTDNYRQILCAPYGRELPASPPADAPQPADAACGGVKVRRLPADGLP